LITTKKIATDETNVAAKWIADQPDESSRIYSARLSVGPEIGYEIILRYKIDNARLAISPKISNYLIALDLGGSVMASRTAASEALESNFIVVFSCSIPS
jgi:hypothetical protein